MFVCCVCALRGIMRVFVVVNVYVLVFMSNVGLVCLCGAFVFAFAIAIVNACLGLCMIAVVFACVFAVVCLIAFVVVCLRFCR